MSDVKVTIPRDDYNPNQRTDIDVEVVNSDGTVSTRTVRGAVQATTQEDGSVSFGILASAHVPFVTATGYASAVLADSPYAYFRHGESSGTTMTDSSGNSRDGVYAGTYTLGYTGILSDGDTAVELNGSSGRGTCDTMLDWVNGQTAFSFECLFSAPTTGNRALMGVLNDGTTQAIHAKINRNALDSSNSVGNLSLYVRDADANLFGAVTTGLSVNDGDWYHVVFTYDAAASPKVHIYVNGDDKTISTSTGGDGSPDNFVAIQRSMGVGCRNNRGSIIDYWLQGLDESAFYRGALSSARVSAHYAAI